MSFDLHSFMPEDDEFDWSTVYSHEKWEADETTRRFKKRADVVLGLSLLRDQWNKAAEVATKFPISFTLDWVILKEEDLKIHTKAEVIDLASAKFCDHLTREFGECFSKHVRHDGVVETTTYTVSMLTSRQTLI